MRERGVGNLANFSRETATEAPCLLSPFHGYAFFVINPTLMRGATCFHRFAVIKYTRKRCVQLQGQVTALQIKTLLNVMLLAIVFDDLQEGLTVFLPFGRTYSINCQHSLMSGGIEI